MCTLPEINPGHYTELLDRLYIAIDDIDRRVLKHPLVEALDNEDITNRISAAISLLSEAYQLVGASE